MTRLRLPVMSKRKSPLPGVRMYFRRDVRYSGRGEGRSLGLT